MSEGHPPTVVDAHAHVWHAVPDYSNPAATIVSPVSDVPAALLREYMDEHGVDRAVLVQPICAGMDNSYIAEVVAENPERFAAVCVVDPVSPAAVEDLEFWAGQGCRGVRLRPRKPDESAAFGVPESRLFWECVRELELVVSVYAGPEHLPVLQRIAEGFPDVPIVVDHMAYPDPAEGPEADAFRELLDLAELRRVHVKVSGYHYFSAEPYPYRDCRQLFTGLYGAFGPDRLLWGSDFPHVLLRCGYRRSLLLQERAYGFLDPQELGAIMGGTASRLYWPTGVGGV